jgi:hypothetical protein
MQQMQTTWHAHATVRVPRDGPGDLTSCVRQRLESPTDIDAVDVTRVRGLEPALAATIVTVDASVSVAETLDGPAVAAALEAAPGCQDVADVERD